MLYLRITLLLLLGAPIASAGEPRGRVFTLDNGMEVVLIENHANPMIACVTVVRAGLVHETLANNGVSHMLEHLLFNGTQRRTQEQLYREADFYGIYNNAHTDELYTNYMALAPAEFIEKALDIQSDMLFNSTIPPEKLEKERGIVVEEIGKDNDLLETLADRFFRRTFYRHTPLAMPVLGTVTSINQMPRQQILDYYQAYYVPNNMTAVVIGDFKSEAMLELMKKYFGRYRARDLPEIKSGRRPAPASQDGEILIESAKTGRAYFSAGLAAPGIDHPDFYAFYMLNAVLASSENAPLVRTLKAKEKPLALRVSSDYNYKKEWGALRIQVSPAPGVSLPAIVEAVKNELAQLGRQGVSPQELKNLVTSLKTGDIYLSEKLHYYGMSISPLLAMAPYGFAASLPEKLEKITPDDIRRVAAAYLQKPLLVTAIQPLETGGEIAEKPPAKIVKRVFHNGLTLIVNENQDSRVLAAHVLARRRSWREPPGKAGIADLMHQMLPLGTGRRSKLEIAEALKSIGAILKVSDDPAIPYDDFYTTPAFSYLRFETIDDFSEPGLELLSDLINQPRFEEKELALLKTQIIDRLRRNRESARERARELFHQTLCANLPEGRSVMGTEDTVRSITRADLQEFHRQYFAPNNLILSIVTNRPAEKIITLVEKLFPRPRQALPPLSLTPCTAPIQRAPVVEKMGKGQSHLYLGAILSDIAASDRAALAIANAILSSRLAFELREKQGWAYSVGSSIGMQDHWGWLTASIGTRPQNLNEAAKAMRRQIETLRTAPLDDEEVERVRNAHGGRMLMRRLSRINAAYYYGLYEFEGLGYDHYDRSPAEWRKVSKADVERVVQKYFPTSEWLTVIVE